MTLAYIERRALELGRLILDLWLGRMLVRMLDRPRGTTRVVMSKQAARGSGRRPAETDRAQ